MRAAAPEPAPEPLRVLAAAALVGLAGAALGGVGFTNGDAAAYAAQAATGELADRSVHLGYLAGAAWLASRVADLPRALDLVSAAASALAVLFAAPVARAGGGLPGIAAFAAAAVILPLAPFAEVDPVWLALVVLARALPGWSAALPMAAAVLVSPTALLAVPWAGWGDGPRLRGIVVGAAVAVVALSVATGGDWWFGARGVLETPLPNPGRAAQAWGRALPWALVPLALVARGTAFEALSWIPLLLAPPDVPAWVLPGWSLAFRAAHGAPRVPLEAVAGLLGIQLAIGGFSAWAAHRRVAEDDAVAHEVAAALGPDDGLVAPFTWGARVSVLATGDPYGLRWRPPEGFLRDQRAAWCGTRLGRVAVLPPGPDGVAWLGPDAPERRAGCVSP